MKNSTMNILPNISFSGLLMGEKVKSVWDNTGVNFWVYYPLSYIGYCYCLQTKLRWLVYGLIHW